MEVRKPTDEELKDVGHWEIWVKEVSEFPWEYFQEEHCYILEGKAEVTLENGKKVEFGKGDFVVFPKGLKCTWKIIEPIKKHYRFG
ncbi:MAG: cupin domain-containing protein [Nanoarchaeota archaeon]